jgi:plasmid stabilization system protein ParE
MAFEIEISLRAEQDIDDAIAYIVRDSKSRAKKWLTGLLLAFDSLKELPNRHSLIEESSQLGRPLRSILYHSHRIVYEVDETPK